MMIWPSLLGSRCIGRTALSIWCSSLVLSSSTLKKKFSVSIESLQLPSQPWSHSWQGWVPPWGRRRGCRAPPTRYLHSRPTSRYSSCFLSNLYSLYIVKARTLHSRLEFRSQQSACNRRLEWRRPRLQIARTPPQGRWLLCGCTLTSWSWRCHTAPANKLRILSTPEPNFLWTMRRCYQRM